MGKEAGGIQMYNPCPVLIFHLPQNNLERLRFSLAVTRGAPHTGLQPVVVSACNPNLCVCFSSRITVIPSKGDSVSETE